MTGMRINHVLGNADGSDNHLEAAYQWHQSKRAVPHDTFKLPRGHVLIFHMYLNEFDWDKKLGVKQHVDEHTKEGKMWCHVQPSEKRKGRAARRASRTAAHT